MLTYKLIPTTEVVFPPVDQHLRQRSGVEWTNPLEHSDWDLQIAEQNHPARSFFHGSAWANVLAETYGYKPLYLVGHEGGMMRSLLPFMEVKSALTGKRAVALPFTDACDPLCADRTAFKELFRNAMELARARNWKYMEFHGGQALLNGTPPSLSFYGHTVSLPSDENKFFGQLKSPVRRAIRKAEKSGVRVEVSTELEAVRSFYVMHCKARRRHGLPPQPYSFFRSIHKHIVARDRGVVVLARWKKTPVAGAVFFQSGNEAVYKFGASDDAFQQLRGNNLVFWEAMRWFLGHGVNQLDLGRTSIQNEGLRRFKLGWNAEEKTTGYFRFSVAQEMFVSTPDQTSGWHTYAFNVLPLFASRMIGKVLYRHWA